LDDTLPSSGPSADFDPPPWIETLNEVRREVVALAAEMPTETASHGTRLPEESLFPAGKPAPFLEIWVPFLRVARNGLRYQAGTSVARLRAEALGTLERQLLLDLSSLGVQVLFDRFEEERRKTEGPRAAAHDPRHHYRAFIRKMLDGALEELFNEYSVLAHQACEAVETWVSGTVELLHRLDRDGDDLAATFNGNKPLGLVRSVRPGLSDRHRGGRQVAELTFESGLRLIYKPRSVRLEEAVHGFLAWLQEKGLSCAPPALTFLQRKDYGWVEVARPSGITDSKDYLRRSGSLLCLADVLRIDDLHWENLIATDNGPVMVDCEMALQPRREGSLPRSILSSQLLTSLQLDDLGRPYETSALRSQGGQLRELSRRAWKKVNTDAMGYEVQRPVAQPGSNVARSAETHLSLESFLRPEDQPRAFLEGYEETYRLLLEHRDEILQRPGPLSPFEDCSTRILFRPTQVYAVLQSRLGAPSYLRSGVVASLLVDSLNRVFVGQEERPLLWPLTHDERQALEKRDVPTFSIGVTEGDALEGSFPAPFKTTGLQAVKERLESLNEVDLRIQSELLTRLLAQPPRFQVPPAAFLPAGNVLGADERDSLQPVESIAQRLLDRQAFPERQPAGFHHLYDGTCGTALLLAALGVHRDDATYREGALRLLEALIADLKKGRLADQALGACHGLGGMVYGLVLAHRLLEEPHCLASASGVASLITEQRVAADQRLDLEGGAAGAILGLLALYDANGDESLLHRAELCAEHLLAHPAARGLASGGAPRGGPAPGGPARPGIPAGLAHGASGFALALARLAARSPREEARQRYASWARLLFAHEEQLIATRGWTDGRWCNGAAGMALARLDAASTLQEGDTGGLELAIQATISRLATTRDDLCCGRMGRADAILELGHQLEDPWLTRTGELAAGAVLEDFQQTGTFRLAVSGASGASGSEASQADLEAPFFSGLSGIAYCLLRRQDPTKFPCVLLFRS